MLLIKLSELFSFGKIRSDLELFLCGSLFDRGEESFEKTKKINEHMMEARIKGKVKPVSSLIELKTFVDSFFRIVNKYLGNFTCCELSTGWWQGHVVIGRRRWRSITRRWRFRWLFQRRGSRGYLTHFFFFAIQLKLEINKISKF